MSGVGPGAAAEVGPAHGGLALCAHDLTVRYGDVVALSDVNLEIPYGATVAVLGPNGSGKSTLFGAGVGLLKPAAGSIGIGERGVSWLPQRLELEPTFPVTVRDVVAMGRWGRRGAGPLAAAPRCGGSRADLGGDGDAGDQ